MATKAVAKKASSNLAVTDERPDFARETHRGSEDVTANDMVIPRLGLTQALSPQINSRKPEYIDGAEQGMFFNIATGKLYGSEVVFVPVYFRKEYIVWRDIDKGGGFRGTYPTHEEALRALNALDDREDCEIVDTGQHYGMVIADDSVDELVLSCATTKHKPSRKLNTLVQMTNADRFASAYRLSAVEAENKAGQEYWNFDVTRLGWVAKEVYDKAEAMYEAVKSGQREVDRGQQFDSGVTRPEDLDG